MKKTRGKSILHEEWKAQLDKLKPYLIDEDCANVAEISGIPLQKVRNATYLAVGQAVLPQVILELTKIVNKRIELTRESEAQISQMFNSTTY